MPSQAVTWQDPPSRPPPIETGKSHAGPRFTARMCDVRILKP